MQIVSGKERKIKMDKKEFALNQHEKWNGKIEVISRAKIETPEDLAVAYTPGVAEPCLKIAVTLIYLISIQEEETWWLS